jgi:hypothetical protein
MGARYLLIPVICVIGAIIVLIFCVPVALWLIGRAIWFRMKYRGARFLVYTRRHGWNEFIKNNLIPACDEQVQAIEIPRSGCARRSWRESHIQAATVGRSKPLLAEVSLLGIRCVPLNETLLPFKQHGGRKPELQGELSALVARLLSRSQTSKN